jgi:ubiquinone biosynthesis protein
MPKHDDEYAWLGPLFTACVPYAPTLGSYLAKVMGHIHFDPTDDDTIKESWITLLKEIAYLSLDDQEEAPRDLNLALEAIKSLGAHQISEKLVHPQILEEAFSKGFTTLFTTLGTYPQLFSLIEHAQFIDDMLGLVAKKYQKIFQLLPAFSSQAVSVLPYLREPSFSGLHDLNDDQFKKLSELTTYILHTYYETKVRPRLAESLKNDLKGKNLLLPLIDDAAYALPPPRCVTAIISLLCTPREELTQGRIISIVLQELGGLYVKISQVLAEIAPPHLARELRRQQDNVGGIFGSQVKSWHYVLNIFEREEFKHWKNWIVIPKKQTGYFAGASVGAIYLFKLTDVGKKELNFDGDILVKVQRPGLLKLFKEQESTLLNIMSNLEVKVGTSGLTESEQIEIYGLISALRRSIMNYAFQAKTELDFNVEKQNANKVREALGNQYPLSIPRFFDTAEDVAIMERMLGEKITKVVRSKYLQKRAIADEVAKAYLDLLFNHGIIWADPHAGNILYDAKALKIHLIDLNPCFTWESETIKEFVYFLYRLILGDENGIFESLELILENPTDLKNEKSQKAIRDFLSQRDQGAFVRYLTEFVRTLGECNVSLKTEVQAALRGISQIYVTSNSISSRNNFGQILQTHLGWKTLARIVWAIGPFKVFKTALPIIFDVLKNTPEEEVGPSLDERDLTALQEVLEHLHDQSVCNISLERTSPEENTRLTLSSDGSRLTKSCHLKMVVMEETKPVTVKYVIEIPTREWLKDRQEYVKLIGLGYSLCVVETMEQLRRHSLDQYWQVTESWNHQAAERSTIEARMVAEVRLAARKLFTRRYQDIWNNNYLNFSIYHRYLWRLMIRLEERFEAREQGRLYLFTKKLGDIPMGNLTFGSIHRLKVIGYKVIIAWIKSLIKKSRFEMNLLPLSTYDLLDRMIWGLNRQTHQQPPPKSQSNR